MLKNKITYVFILCLMMAGYIGADIYLDHREQQETLDIFQGLVPLIDIPQNANTEQVADAVREFVNSNSVHKIDEEFYSYWGDHARIASMLKDHATGKTDKRPHMECSSRAGTMQNILQALGYRVRSVDVYKHSENFPAHVFLDVQDPTSGQWHSQDPGYDLFWVNKETKERINAIDIITLTPENILPCHDNEECGWKYKNPQAQGKKEPLKPYLGLTIIKDDIEKTRNLYYNNTIFPLHTPMKTKKNGTVTYCEAIDKNCRGEIVNVGTGT